MTISFRLYHRSLEPTPSGVLKSPVDLLGSASSTGASSLVSTPLASTSPDSITKHGVSLPNGLSNPYCLSTDSNRLMPNTSASVTISAVAKSLVLPHTFYPHSTTPCFAAAGRPFVEVTQGKEGELGIRCGQKVENEDYETKRSVGPESYSATKVIEDNIDEEEFDEVAEDEAQLNLESSLSSTVQHRQDFAVSPHHLSGTLGTQLSRPEGRQPASSTLGLVRPHYSSHSQQRHHHCSPRPIPTLEGVGNACHSVWP
ncbi:unnamed protein product [Protopolystoma xenopodis]|uniref:Uncharacterized protein n=1 Tax=Protopolystoma xenopodis TaxID=117903 RepID=A0A3S5CJB7_9PLAT|nr:unnamed protein product [Protopolystoma xenopodis]